MEQKSGEQEMNGKVYVHNLETQKIELQFSKSEYQALTDGQKKEIKRYFMFKPSASAWVSKSTNNHYMAIVTAEKLGFTDGGKEGQRLSYEEQLKQKAERAEAKVGRFEAYADNAIARGKSLQTELESYRGDNSFFTQPIIRGHAGSEAFAKRRQRIFDRYGKGFEEYRKSEYFSERAATAQATADMKQLESKTYLNNRMEEGKARIRGLERYLVQAEEKQNEKWCTALLDSMEIEMDKLAFFENCMEKLGGVAFSKDNVKAGYEIKISRKREWAVVVKANVKTVEVKFSSVPYSLKYNFADIQNMRIPEGWQDPTEQIEHPFAENDFLIATFIGSSKIRKAFQIMKVTEKNIVVQEIKVEMGKPLFNDFANKIQQRRKVKKDISGTWTANYDDYSNLYLYKLEEPGEKKA